MVCLLERGSKNIEENEPGGAEISSPGRINVEDLRLKVIRNIFFASVIVLMLIYPACGGSSTGDINKNEILISIKNGNVEGDKIVKVKKGEQVKLKFTSDQEMSIHLHGYDIEAEIPMDGSETIEFEAHATGAFPVTAHISEENHSSHTSHEIHGKLFESPTLLEGDSYTYTLDIDMHPGVIPFHDHMSHNISGAIVASLDASEDDVIIIIKDDMQLFHPNEVTVKPGATIKWVSKNPDKVRITSGDPPADSHAGHNAGSHEAGTGEHTTEEERSLLTVEVRP